MRKERARETASPHKGGRGRDSREGAGSGVGRDGRVGAAEGGGLKRERGKRNRGKGGGGGEGGGGKQESQSPQKTRPAPPRAPIKAPDAPWAALAQANSGAVSLRSTMAMEYALSMGTDAGAPASQSASQAAVEESAEARSHPPSGGKSAQGEGAADKGRQDGPAASKAGAVRGWTLLTRSAKDSPNTGEGGAQKGKAGSRSQGPGQEAAAWPSLPASNKPARPGARAEEVSSKAGEGEWKAAAVAEKKPKTGAEKLAAMKEDQARKLEQQRQEQLQKQKSLKPKPLAKMEGGVTLFDMMKVDDKKKKKDAPTNASSRTGGGSGGLSSRTAAALAAATAVLGRSGTGAGGAGSKNKDGRRAEEAGGRAGAAAAEKDHFKPHAQALPGGKPSGPPKKKSLSTLKKRILQERLDRYRAVRAVEEAEDAAKRRSEGAQIPAAPQGLLVSGPGEGALAAPTSAVSPAALTSGALDTFTASSQPRTHIPTQTIGTHAPGAAISAQSATSVASAMVRSDESGAGGGFIVQLLNVVRESDLEDEDEYEETLGDLKSMLPLPCLQDLALVHMPRVSSLAMPSPLPTDAGPGEAGGVDVLGQQAADAGAGLEGEGDGLITVSYVFQSLALAQQAAAHLEGRIIGGQKASAKLVDAQGPGDLVLMQGLCQPEDLEDDDEHGEILDNVRALVEPFGVIRQVVLPQDLPLLYGPRPVTAKDGVEGGEGEGASSDDMQILLAPQVSPSGGVAEEGTQVAATAEGVRVEVGDALVDLGGDCLAAAKAAATLHGTIIGGVPLRVSVCRLPGVRSRMAGKAPAGRENQEELSGTARWYSVCWLQGVVTSEELEDVDEYEEISTDMCHLAEAFGPVRTVSFPRTSDGEVLVQIDFLATSDLAQSSSVMNSIQAAESACAGLSGRVLGGHSIRSHHTLPLPSWLPLSPDPTCPDAFISAPVAEMMQPQSEGKPMGEAVTASPQGLDGKQGGEAEERSLQPGEGTASSGRGGDEGGQSLKIVLENFVTPEDLEDEDEVTCAPDISHVLTCPLTYELPHVLSSGIGVLQAEEIEEDLLSLISGAFAAAGVDNTNVRSDRTGGAGGIRITWPEREGEATSLGLRSAEEVRAVVSALHGKQVGGKQLIAYSEADPPVSPGTERQPTAPKAPKAAMSPTAAPFKFGGTSPLSPSLSPTAAPFVLSSTAPMPRTAPGISAVPTSDAGATFALPSPAETTALPGPSAVFPSALSGPANTTATHTSWGSPVSAAEPSPAPASASAPVLAPGAGVGANGSAAAQTHPPGTQAAAGVTAVKGGTGAAAKPEGGAGTAEAAEAVDPTELVLTRNGKKIPQKYAPAKLIPKVQNTGAVREYVSNQRIDSELDQLVFDLLHELMDYQERARLKDPAKAKMRRRLVFGLREVKRGIKADKVKCVVVAPNIDQGQIAGGLDDTVNEIIQLAREAEDTHLIFALSKKKIGKALNKSIKVSAIGIYSSEGAHDMYKKVMKRMDQLREET